MPSAVVPTGIELPGSDDHDHGAESVPAPPIGDASKAAAAFAAAWVRDLPAEQWRAGIAPLCEDGFAKLMATVDPANIPAGRVTGAPSAVSPPGEGLAVYAIPTDGGTLTVTVAAIGGKWLASNNDFERTS